MRTGRLDLIAVGYFMQFVQKHVHATICREKHEDTAAVMYFNVQSWNSPKGTKNKLNLHSR
jgi:hypothetical protein